MSTLFKRLVVALAFKKYFYEPSACNTSSSSRKQCLDDEKILTNLVRRKSIKPDRDFSIYLTYSKWFTAEVLTWNAKFWHFIRSYVLPQARTINYFEVLTQSSSYNLYLYFEARSNVHTLQLHSACTCTCTCISTVRQASVVIVHTVQFKYKLR